MAFSAASSVFLVESQYDDRRELGTSNGGGGGAHFAVSSIGLCISLDRNRWRWTCMLDGL
jgi:hypothetical protein